MDSLGRISGILRDVCSELRKAGKPACQEHLLAPKTGACTPFRRAHYCPVYPERFRTESCGSPASAWCKEATGRLVCRVEKAAWKDPAELKAQFGSASVVSGERVVFNIKGNDYRLVVAINYHYQIILIIWLGTHQEYNRIDVTKITFARERYADSSDSN